MQTQNPSVRTEVPTSLIKNKIQKEKKVEEWQRKSSDTHDDVEELALPQLKFKRTRAADTKLQMYLQVDKLCSGQWAQRWRFLLIWLACSFQTALVCLCILVKINYKQLKIKSNVLSAVRLVEIYWPGIPCPAATWTREPLIYGQIRLLLLRALSAASHSISCSWASIDRLHL